MARTRTRRGWVPLMTKPTVRIPSPESGRLTRVERLLSLARVASRSFLRWVMRVRGRRSASKVEIMTRCSEMEVVRPMRVTDAFDSAFNREGLSFADANDTELMLGTRVTKARKLDILLWLGRPSSLST